MYGLCREAAVEDPLEMVALGLISYKGMHPDRAPRYVEDQEPEIVELADAMGIHRGEFLGAPPSGEVGTYSSIRIHRIVGARSPRSGVRVVCWACYYRLLSEKPVRVSVSSRTLGWHEASSRPHFLRRCPHLKIGRSLPITGPPAR